MVKMMMMMMMMMMMILFRDDQLSVYSTDKRISCIDPLMHKEGVKIH